MHFVHCICLGRNAIAFETVNDGFEPNVFFGVSLCIWVIWIWDDWISCCCCAKAQVVPELEIAGVSPFDISPPTNLLNARLNFLA